MKFKLNYYYKWNGKTPADIRKWSPKRKKILDGKWHKCITFKNIGDGSYCFEASFENVPSRFPWTWTYNDLLYFIECKYPPKNKIIKLLKEMK